jgi:hypothetical protein
MEKYELIRLLAVNARELYSSTLVGNPAPATKELGEIIKNPKVGDLVLELSRAIYIYADQFPGRYDEELKESAYMGRLISITEEPIDRNSEEKWDEKEEGRPVPLEKVWVIEKLLDGSVVRWSNANFIKVIEPKKEQ